MEGANLTVLPWDSGFFGCPVARIQMDYCDNNRLTSLLARCRHSGLRFVYAFLPCGSNVSLEIISSFSGRLVDQKTTLVKDLSTNPSESKLAVSDSIRIAPWPSKKLAPELLDLAIESGGKSRYRVDPEIPYEQFHRLYEIWMRRSVGRQIADEVLVARQNPGDEVVGMTTMTVREGIGNIGLIAVRKDQRGREVGSSLLQTAEVWMREREAVKSTLVTQLANRASVRMCERCGYAIESVQDVYHFRPLRMASGLRLAA